MLCFLPCGSVELWPSVVWVSCAGEKTAVHSHEILLASGISLYKPVVLVLFRGRFPKTGYESTCVMNSSF